MIRKLICISCPVGCQLTVEVEGDRVVAVKGNCCPRGELYAKEEVTDPKRILATSVKVVGGELPLVSVRTAAPIPKQLIPRAMAEIRKLSRPAPVRLGEVLVEDLLGTGVALIATREVKKGPGG